MVWGSNPGEGEIFRTRPDRPWGPPSLLYNEYRVLSGVKSDRGVTLTPHPVLCRCQERVDLHLYSPYGPYGLTEPQCLHKGALYLYLTTTTTTTTTTNVTCQSRTLPLQGAKVFRICYIPVTLD